MKAVTFRDVRPYLSLREESLCWELLGRKDDVGLAQHQADMVQKYEDEVLAERAFAQGSAA